MDTDLVARLTHSGVDEAVARALLRALADGVGEVDSDSLDLLVRAGFADIDEGGARLHPPGSVLSMRAREHDAHASALRYLSGPLQALYRASEDRGGPVLHLRSVAAVQEMFLRLQQDAHTRIRALDRGPYRAARSRAPSPVQTASMARGVEYEVIYAAEAIDTAATREEIYDAVRAGERARVLPDVPIKMVLADGDAALVVRLTPCERIEGFVVQPGLLLDTLAGFFDTLWQLALPVRPSVEDGEAADVSAVLRGLALGLTDEAIGRELGVSERTVARRIARLQQIYATRSRFQLGVQAARLGLV
ncbi:MAG: hypothetical protein Q4G43_07200 [Mobilicoccus sp.]|nr:hypothetical protein [Mobilicoccus sp.]